MSVSNVQNGRVSIDASTTNPTATATAQQVAQQQTISQGGTTTGKTKQVATQSTSVPTDGMDANGTETESTQALLNQTGLNLEMPAASQEYIANLPADLRAGLTGVSSAMTTALTVNAPAGNDVATTTTVPDPNATDALQSRWGEYMAKVALNGNVDINALVQQVLRDSYLETNQDLEFYAEKVKFYNDCKQKIRAELTRARNTAANYAGQPDTTQLSPPFVESNIQTEYFGGTTAQSSSQADLTQASQAAQNLQQAQQALTNAQKSQSGGGVHQASAGELAGLDPQPPSGSQVYMTAGGYAVAVKGSEVDMYAPSGKELTHIWGDPHVNEDGTNDDKTTFDFGQNSTFILPDGSKVCLKTKEYNGKEREVSQVDILSGTDHASAPAGTVTQDRAAWDNANADAAGGSASGVFALELDGSGNPTDNWAVRAPDGKFYDVNDTSSSTQNQEAGQVSYGSTPVTVSDASVAAAADHVANVSAAQARLTTAQQAAPNLKTCSTKADLDTYIQNTEDELNSVGDDAQLANVDLQNMLQKQQQTLQMMSNISKMLNDTAMAVIRKIGG